MSVVEELKKILEYERKTIASPLLKALEESEAKRKEESKTTKQLMAELEIAKIKIAILEEANKDLRIGRGIAYVVVSEPPVNLCEKESCHNPAPDGGLCDDCLSKAIRELYD